MAEICSLIQRKKTIIHPPTPTHIHIDGCDQSFDCQDKMIAQLPHPPILTEQSTADTHLNQQTPSLDQPNSAVNPGGMGGNIDVNGMSFTPPPPSPTPCFWSNF